MPTLFNNCKGREHARIYGDGAAFYDVNVDGAQAVQARDVRVGDECIVATRGRSEDITFTWFHLTREEVRSDDTGTTQRVFFGQKTREEMMSKSEACKTAPYSAFFNINGDFKQQSVIRATAT